MAAAVCFKCGEEKHAPFEPCRACAAVPRLHSERVISLAISDELSPLPQLLHYANEIRDHLRLSVPDSVLELARNALRPRNAAPASIAPDSAPPRAASPATPSTRLAGGDTEARRASMEPGRKESIATTALHRNPFWVLGATVRDDRKRIVELADARALADEAGDVQKARAELTKPRSRLSAEVAWLPGLSPRRAQKLIDDVASGRAKLHMEDGLPLLAHANLAAAAFEIMTERTEPKAFAALVMEMAEVVDELDVDDIMRDINEDRAVSGFPEVTSAEAIEAELVERRRHYRTAIKDALNRLPAASIVTVMDEVVTDSTLDGSHPAYGLVDELVDGYEVETQDFLQKEAENVTKLIEAARRAAAGSEAVVKPLVDNLERVVRNWVSVAHPIQVSAKGRGTSHEASKMLAREIRSLGIDLFNEHDQLAATNRITALLKELFEHVPEFAEQVEEDAQALQNIVEKRKEAQAQQAEWEKEIAFEGEVGMVFKEKLAISRDGLRWGDKVYPLEAVTRVRWGAIRHSVNGIPSGTSYTIAFGDDHSEAVVSLKRESIFSGFLPKLMLAVGWRIMNEIVASLKQNHTLTFGKVAVTDEGAILQRRKFLSSEPIRVPWGDVQIWSADGQFFMESKHDKKSATGMSYLEVPNAHLLELIIRAAFKKGARRLSEAFND